MKYALTVLVSFALAETVQAVSFSEVAWMGDATSANHEWIELYNSGPNIVVDGWTITDGMNLEIALSGEVPASRYVVLERTSEESALGPAFLVYTGSLVNTGATLTLKNSAGEIIDQVAGGEDWKNIGGDNITKETAQYRSTGWVTDSATPGAINGSGRVDSPASVPSKEKTASLSSGQSQVTIRKVESDAALAFMIEHQSVAYVGQAVRFLADPKTKNHNSNLLRYHWNFGDAGSGDGTEVEHVYQHPGEYVVVAYLRKGMHEEVVRSEITVVPVSVSVALGVGVVYVHNNSPYDIDVTGYRVVAEKTVTFPERSFIKTGGTITFTPQDLGSWHAGVVLLDSAGVEVSNSGADTMRVQVASVDQSLVKKEVSARSVTDAQAITSVLSMETGDGLLSIATGTIYFAPQAVAVRPVSRMWYGAVSVLILLSLLWVYQQKSIKKFIE